MEFDLLSGWAELTQKYALPLHGKRFSPSVSSRHGSQCRRIRNSCAEPPAGRTRFAHPRAPAFP